MLRFIYGAGSFTKTFLLAVVVHCFGFGDSFRPDALGPLSPLPPRAFGQEPTPHQTKFQRKPPVTTLLLSQVHFLGPSTLPTHGRAAAVGDGGGMIRHCLSYRPSAPTEYLNGRTLHSRPAAVGRKTSRELHCESAIFSAP